MVALFVVLTFIIFLVADYFVLKARKKEHPAFATMPVFDKNSLFFPLTYLLSRGHVWVALVQENVYRLGIDEFILKAFGKVTITDVVPVGTNVRKGDVIFKVQNGNKKVSFRAPFSGAINAVNTQLANRSVEDIYQSDWAVSITPDGVLPEELKSKKIASQWLHEEVKRFKDFLTLQTADPALAGLTMADGGHITEGAANHLSESAVADFEKSFLMQ